MAKNPKQKVYTPDARGRNRQAARKEAVKKGKTLRNKLYRRRDMKRSK